jgi:hypothetical protein
MDDGAGVTNDVNEQNMRDLERDLLLDLGRHVSARIAGFPLTSNARRSMS